MLTKVNVNVVTTDVLPNLYIGGNKLKVVLTMVLLMFLFASSFDAKAQPGNVDCSQRTIIENGMCPSGFSQWTPIYPELVPFGDCGNITVFFKTRYCLDNPAIVDIDIVFISINFLQLHDPCWYLLNYIAGLNPQDSAINMAYIERTIYQNFIKNGILKSANFSKKNGWNHIESLCPPEGNGSPNIHTFSRNGQCVGYCITRKPDVGYVLQKYNVDITPLYSGFNSEENIPALNDYINNHINPKLPVGEYIKLIENPQDAIFFIKPITCMADWCCFNAYRYCFTGDWDENKGEYVNVEWTVMEDYSDWPGYQPPGVHCPDIGLPPITECIAGTSYNRIPCEWWCGNDVFPPMPLSIAEATISNIVVAPNPTNNGTKLSFNVLSEGNLKVTLFNAQGQELLELYNAKVGTGKFIKDFSMSKFPVGSYFIKINHNNKVKYENIIRN